MANSGIIILAVFLFFLVVGAGLYYGNVTCPNFGAKCSPAPRAPSPQGVTPRTYTKISGRGVQTDGTNAVDMDGVNAGPGPVSGCQAQCDRHPECAGFGYNTAINTCFWKTNVDDNVYSNNLWDTYKKN